MHLWDFKRAGIQIWDFWMFKMSDIGYHSESYTIPSSVETVWGLIVLHYTQKIKVCLKIDMVCRFRSLGMQNLNFRYTNMDFFKTPHIQIRFLWKDPVFKYEFLVLFIHPCIYTQCRKCWNLCAMGAIMFRKWDIIFINLDYYFWKLDFSETLMLKLLETLFVKLLSRSPVWQAS